MGTPTPAEIMDASTAAQLARLQKAILAIPPNPVFQVWTVMEQVNTVASGAARVKAATEALAQVMAPSVRAWEQVMREVQASTEQATRNLAALQRLSVASDIGFAVVGASVAARLADAAVETVPEDAAQGDAGTMNALQWLLFQILVGLPAEQRDRASKDPVNMLALLGIVIAVVVGLGNGAVTLLKSSPPPTIVVQPAEVQAPDVYVHIDGDGLRATIDDAVDRELRERGIDDPDH